MNLMILSASEILSGLSAKTITFWNNLGVNVQIGMQLFSLLMMFFVLSRLFACKTKNSCWQGCKCGCGEACDCKVDSK